LNRDIIIATCVYYYVRGDSVKLDVRHFKASNLASAMSTFLGEEQHSEEIIKE